MEFLETWLNIFRATSPLFWTTDAYYNSKVPKRFLKNPYDEYGRLKTSCHDDEG